MAYGTVNADVIGTSVAGSNLGAGNASAMKNRIINGAMAIDQRNAGASVNTSTANVVTYTLDRWAYLAAVVSKFTIQQNAGSVTPPAGFSNYLGCTSASAYSVGAAEYFLLEHIIEGYNIADLGWGTANAKAVTLSFQVYSSLTGTFGGSIQNNDSTRSYPFTYTVSSANTWTTVSVTIAGCPNGTWQSTNSGGMRIYFGLGTGSTYSGAAGSWASTNYIGATGTTSVVGTSGATWYITGVQLEVGSSATGFEYRQYGTELVLCQRYFEKSVSQATAVQIATQANFYGNMQASIATGIWYMTLSFNVTKRAAPTVTTYPYTTPTNTNRFSNNVGSDYGADSASVGGIYDSQFSIQNNSGSTLTVGSGIVFGSWFATAEL